jgi:16S rRNA (cytosine1402-N4)-methyltransferase
MLKQVVDMLAVAPGKIIVDATLGGGGHSNRIAEALQPGGKLIGIDRDPDALEEAGRVLRPWGDSVVLVHDRFDNIQNIIGRLQIDHIDGVLFDLGVSSHQLDTPERGFSFKDEGAALDMRMDSTSSGPTAADLVNSLSERELTELIRGYSDERWAARIAKIAVEHRAKAPLLTTGDLVKVVHAAIPVAARPPDIHAATRTFQALRIAVNDELTVVGHALESAISCLARGGIIVALSYHSSEDRIVKQTLARFSGRGEGVGPYGIRPDAVLEVLTRKPLTPDASEVHINPRARSAKLRAARHL